MEITAERRQIPRDRLVPVGPCRGGHLFHDRRDGTSYLLQQGGSRRGGTAVRTGAWVGGLLGAPLIQLVGSTLVGESASNSTWPALLVGVVAALPLALVFEFTGVRQQFDLVVVRATTAELLEVRRSNGRNVRYTVLFVMGYPLLVVLLGWLAKGGGAAGVSITFAVSMSLLPMWAYALRWSIGLHSLLRAWRARQSGTATDQASRP